MPDLLFYYFYLKKKTLLSLIKIQRHFSKHVVEIVGLKPKPPQEGRPSNTLFFCPHFPTSHSSGTMAAKPEDSPAAPAVIPPAANRDPVVKFSGEEAEEEKEEREVKRRRTCPPAALQKISSPPPPPAVEEDDDEEARVSGRERFSFSFNARGVAPIETTPKFGSFNCSADQVALGAAKEGEEKAKNGKEEGGEVKNESKTAS